MKHACKPCARQVACALSMLSWHIGVSSISYQHTCAERAALALCSVSLSTSYCGVGVVALLVACFVFFAAGCRPHILFEWCEQD